METVNRERGKGRCHPNSAASLKEAGAGLVLQEILEVACAEVCFEIEGIIT